MYGAFYDPMKYEFIHVFEYGIYGNAIYALECDERRPIYSVALRHFPIFHYNNIYIEYVKLLCS